MLKQANKDNDITKEGLLFNEKTISLKNNIEKNSQVFP